MGRRLIIALIVILIIGAGFAIVSVRLSRELYSSTDLEPPLYPSFLYGSFMVTEADTGISDPSAKVAVDLHYNENYTYTDFVFRFFLLNSTLEQFEQISDVSTIDFDDENVVGGYWFITEPPTHEFPLLNIPCNYVWVLWIDAESIPESWTIDVTLALNFSIL